jgi:hypothetical protein
MSHRIEPYATLEPFRRSLYHPSNLHYSCSDARLARITQAHPSPPPPIATLPQSPSLSSSSLDRSSVSSPAPTRRGSTQSVLATSYSGEVCYQSTESDRPRAFYQPPTGLTESPYRVQPRTEPRYVSAQDGNPRAAAYPPAVHVVPSQISGGAHDLTYHYSGQHQFNAIYTDDATTKLNDRIRRRCFNCCTTDTSTWRRSSLNPGKVVSTQILIRSRRSDVGLVMQQVRTVRTHTQPCAARAVSSQAWPTCYIIAQSTAVTTSARRSPSRQCPSASPI